MSKKTFKAVKKAKGELIVQIKGNQQEFYREARGACAYLEPISSYKPHIEKARNRIEKRSYTVFDVTSCLIESSVWRSYVNCVIKVERKTELFDTKSKSWKTRKEVSYYASSHRHKAEYFAKYIRQHWYTENCNHYVRDVTLGEDASRIRSNAGIFARLRSFVLNILRFNNIRNVSKALFENALDFDGMLQLKGVIC